MTPKKAPSGDVACGALGEDRLLAQLLPALLRCQIDSVVLGVGDDCAIVRVRKSRDHLVLKTDCLVEGIHFRSTALASLVGRKAMTRPLSDFAAISGVPKFALVTLIVAKSKTLTWV